MAQSNSEAGDTKSPAAKKKVTRKKSTSKKARGSSRAKVESTDEKLKTQDADLEKADTTTVVAPTSVDESKPGVPPTAGSATETRSSGGSSAVAWFALLLSLVAIAAGGYAWYLTAVDSKLVQGQSENRYELVTQRVNGFEQQQSDLGAQISQLRAQLAQSDSDIAERIRNIRNEAENYQDNIDQQIEESQNALQDQSENFSNDFATLSDSITRMRADLGRSIDSWTLEEVEQLLIIAQQRIEFAGEGELARRALVLADEQLEKLSDPALNELRQQLSQDILALDSVAVDDPVTVLSSLAALSAEVYKLPLAGDIPVPGEESNSSAGTVPNQEGDASDSGAGMMDSVNNAAVSFFESLGDLIQVEKNGQSLKPVVSDHLRQLTYERTRLYLEGAQIAYLRKDTALYGDRIGGAREWVMENFDTASSLTSNWLAELDEVMNSSPMPVLPDISASLDAMKNVMDNRQ